jgi:hypothetical protein
MVMAKMEEVHRKNKGIMKLLETVVVQVREFQNSILVTIDLGTLIKMD